MSDIKNIKVIQLISSLSETERRVLKKYINNNGSDTFYQLYQFIHQYAPNFDEDNFTWEKMTKKIYSVKGAKINELSTLLSKLYLLVNDFVIKNEDWLIINKIDNEKLSSIAKVEKKIKGQLIKLRFFNQRKLFQLYHKTEIELEQLFKEYPFKNSFYYQQVLNFEKERFFFQGRYRDKRQGDLNIQSQADILDKFYLLDKMILLCHMINRQSVTGSSYELELLDEIIEYFPTSRYKDDLLLNFWFNVLKLVKVQEEPEIYSFLKQKLFDDSITIDMFDKRIVFTILENLSKYNASSTEEYNNSLFDLYRGQNDLKIFQLTKTLLPTLFLNISTLGLRLKEYKWVHNFITENENNIIVEAADELEIIKDVVYLDYYVTTKKLEEIKNLIDKIDLEKNIRYKDVKNNTAIRRNIIRGYHELGELELLTDSINAYKRFIYYHNDEIQEPYNKANRLFVVYIKKLIAVDTVYSNLKDSEIDAIINTLQEEGAVYDKAWIIEKLKEKKNIKLQAEDKLDQLLLAHQNYKQRYPDRVANIKLEVEELMDNVKLPARDRKEMEIAIKALENEQ